MAELTLQAPLILPDAWRPQPVAIGAPDEADRRSLTIYSCPDNLATPRPAPNGPTTVTVSCAPASPGRAFEAPMAAAGADAWT